MVRILGAGQRLVDFHAGPTGIGENGVDTFALEACHEDLAAGHCGPEFRLLSRVFFLVLAVVLLICLSCCGHGRGQIKKPTTVASRGFLSKSSSTSTSTNGAVSYDDYQQDCLPSIVQHSQESYSKNDSQVKLGSKNLSHCSATLGPGSPQELSLPTCFLVHSSNLSARSR